MGARLRYAKVIDRELFFVKGGRVHPGLHNEVLLNEEPGVAAAFLVLRGYANDKGSVTERWVIEGPGGLRMYQSSEREIHLPTKAHEERLEDEVADLKIDVASDDYNVVFYLDERQVARVAFEVKLNSKG